MFALVPPEAAAWAATTVPWRSEPLVYGSDLADRLPAGLTMPRALRVDERPDETAVLWLEAVDHARDPWTVETYVEAAGLLGRMSGSPRVAEVADLDPLPWHIGYFVEGRIGHTVLPGLLDDATRQHLVVARLPHRASHGDACPNNLLRHTSGAGFTLIDYGFWRPQPIGFDLSQLLVGDIQVGRREADDLPELAAACLEAYADGLAAEGLELPFHVLRRAHAVSLVLFNGLPSLPPEMLGAEVALAGAGGVTDEFRAALDHWTRQRAAIARYSLGVLADTEAAA